MKFFLKKRFVRIIYPFIFWIILILVQIAYTGGNQTYLWNVFTGNPSFTWYFWVLIGIYLFMPILNSFVKEYGDEALKYFLIIWFALMVLQTFHIELWEHLNLSYFTGYVGYPILGYYLANKEFKISDKKVCISGLIILLISLACFVYLNYIGSSAIESIYENVPMIFMTSGLFLFIQ